MRRVGECETANPTKGVVPAKGVVPLRRAGVTLGITLALALSVPTVASAATITVNEQGESATFIHGGNTPNDYFDSIDKLSNHNDLCSLREAIAASNTNEKVDGCAAGSGPGDVISVPAGFYPVYDNLFVRQRVIIRGANAGTPGNDPHRGRETVIKFVYNPQSQAQVGMFWLGDPGPNGPADGGGSEFDGLTLVGNSNPLCAVEPPVAGTCEEWAIVQPEKSGGGANAAGEGRDDATRGEHHQLVHPPNRGDDGPHAKRAEPRRLQSRTAEPPQGLDHDRDDDRLDAVEHPGRSRHGAEPDVRSREAGDDERGGEDEADPGDEQPGPAAPAVSDVDRHLGGVGPGDQIGRA